MKLVGREILFEPLFLELKDVPLFQQLAKIEIWMITLGHLDRVVELLRDACHQKLRESLEVVATLLMIKHKKSIPIDRIMDHMVWWEATKLHDLKELIVIVLSRENWRLDEELDDSAAEGPHVD